MQIIFQFAGDPESYIAGDCQTKVAPPKRCPHCGRKKCMQALGYYYRGISAAVSGEILTFWIRRFLCTRFGFTVSMLPDFAQPYRLVRNSTVQKAFSGECPDIDVIRWNHLLKRYWRRFVSWFPVLLEKAAEHSGPSPPAPKHIWHFFTSAWGEMSCATHHLVGVHRITAFGRYRCHQIPSKANAEK